MQKKREYWEDCAEIYSPKCQTAGKNILTLERTSRNAFRNFSGPLYPHLVRQRRKLLFFILTVLRNRSNNSKPSSSSISHHVLWIFCNNSMLWQSTPPDKWFRRKYLWRLKMPTTCQEMPRKVLFRKNTTFSEIWERYFSFVKVLFDTQKFFNGPVISRKCGKQVKREFSFQNNDSSTQESFIT